MLRLFSDKQGAPTANLLRVSSVNLIKLLELVICQEN